MLKNCVLGGSKELGVVYDVIVETQFGTDLQSNFCCTGTVL